MTFNADPVPVFCVLLAVASIFAGCTGTAPPRETDTIPADDFRGWNLTVNGTTRASYTFDEIRAFPTKAGNCYAVSTVGIKYGPYTCKGVLLTDLLEQSGGIAEGDQVWVSAPDGYLWVFDYDQTQGEGFITFNESLREIPSPPLQVLLMYEQDGKPLSYDDGGPVRLVIISEEEGIVTEGSAWVKWVDTIEVKRK
ncbi:MAG TPA: molybdopterin-dependent oxidoreductase [Methanoregulaceae archaeon]|nr:molybdopterin-dependent oxidoreductase [Methanoregulaceae archaeon]